MNSTEWICPHCGTDYYGSVYQFLFCPHCRAEKDKLEQEYWDNIKAGQDAIANGIVSRVLRDSNPTTALMREGALESLTNNSV